MKLKDIANKKIILYRNNGCEWYWDYQYVVELDEDNVCCINHSGSFSGWNPLFIESVDKEFVSSFMEIGVYRDDWEKSNDLLNKHINMNAINVEADWGTKEVDFKEIEIIPLNKKYVLSFYEEETE